MAEQSEISWTDATHNEWIGCTRVSPGCQRCYAETLMDTRYGRVKWGKGQPRVLTSEANRRKPLTWDKAAARAGTRTRVFSASLSDWLDDEVPAEFLAGLLATVARTPNLDWLLLSKRPHQWRERLEAAAPKCKAEAFVRGWLDGHAPANVWVGTTVEDQQRADERLPGLYKIPSRVAFLSCEPLLGPIDLRLSRATPRIEWVIVGGESCHGARPMHPAWARSLRDQAKAADVPFHFKQWGEHAFSLDEPAKHARGGVLMADEGDLPYWTVGKKAAGRLLDGREWNEFPRAAQQGRSETP